MKDGTRVYRLLKGEIFPLGIGFTTKPAADVEGLYSENVTSKNITFKDKRDIKAYFDIKNNIFSKKNDPLISHLHNDDVKNKKETNMDIEQILAELKGLLIEKKFSEEADLNRENLYRALSKKGNPTFTTFNKILEALGLQLTVEQRKSG
jgi:DNA-binding phage protein